MLFLEAICACPDTLFSFWHYLYTVFLRSKLGFSRTHLYKVFWHLKCDNILTALRHCRRDKIGMMCANNYLFTSFFLHLERVIEIGFSRNTKETPVLERNASESC